MTQIIDDLQQGSLAAIVRAHEMAYEHAAQLTSKWLANWSGNPATANKGKDERDAAWDYEKLLRQRMWGIARTVATGANRDLFR